MGWNDTHLYVVAWNGGNPGSQKALATALGCEMECRNTDQPAWSPDNRWLVFTGPGRNLAAVRSTGGPTFDLTGPPTGDKAVGQFDPIWT